MAHVQKGMLIPAPQWWRHLREWKRVFWRKHRKAEKRLARDETRKRDNEWVKP